MCDVHDLEALSEVVTTFRPDVMLHELTDLPEDAGRIPEMAAANDRIRREGTRNLLAAAAAAGSHGFVAQSVAWPIPRNGGAAVEEHERTVLEARGVVLRYGSFYGPGTYHEAERPEPPRIHIDEAARRTLPALTAPSGILVIAEEP